MKSLVIDIGNTRTKVGIFDQQQLLKAITLDDPQEIDPEEIISMQDISKSIISATKEIPSALLSGLSKLKPNIVLDDQTKLPFTNLYHSKNTLGRDRIALIAAAHANFPNLDNLVIGCGTCITFNF